MFINEKEMINAKKKGNHGENNFANWLSSHGFKAYRNTSSGGGINKSDIHNGLDMTIEVKTVKRINIQDAWYQVTRDSSTAGNMPVLALHFDGMKKDTWLITLHSEDWIELQKELKDLKQKLALQDK